MMIRSRRASTRMLCIWLLLAAAQAPMTAHARDTEDAENTRQPHILLIVADDLGWNDVGYHGSIIETPNIDRIAAQGIELDRFYVQPTCSPTRAGLMTGKSPVRLGIYRPLDKNSEHGLPLGERILPQYLAELGYQTAITGKWHLGRHRRAQLPNARGFEHAYGSLTGGIGYWNKVHGGGYDWHRNGRTVREEGYVTHLLAREVQTLISHRDPARPHFLYLAFQAPHLPNEAPETTTARYADVAAPPRQVHAAMVDEMDQAIGEVLALYEAAGMLDNTLVLFMSDNGGLVPPGPDPATHSGIVKLGLLAGDWFDRPVPAFPFPGLEFIVANVLDAGSDNSPLPGGKGGSTEGGVRVPAAIWWPGRLDQGRHERPMTVSDVLPTLLDAIGAEHRIPDDLDGRSQWAALTGGSSETPDYVVSDYFGLAVYRWPWKLIDGDVPRLFNVEEDPFEERDLAAERPDLLATLQSRLAEWNYAEDPGVPLYELLFDPDTFGGAEDREPWADVVID